MLVPPQSSTGQRPTTANQNSAISRKSSTPKNLPLSFLPSDTPASQPCRKLCGLENKGSTCYVNALIQCLFVLPHFYTTLWLLVAGSLQESLEVFRKPSSSDNFCYFCREIRSGCVVREFLDCGSHLIIQLLRFCEFRGAFT